MTYLLTGNLCAEMAADFSEPLADVAIRFYRQAVAGDAGGSGRPEGTRVGAIAQPAAESTAESPAASDGRAATLSGQDVAAKEGRWIAQVRTGGAGEFSIDLSRPSILGGAGVAYAGEPLEVDVFAPGAKDERGEDAVGSQFSVGVVRPEWNGDGAVRTASVELRIPREAWGRIRAATDAWVIAGRVLLRATGGPLAGARVSAFDADLVGDDPLGSGLTDAEGRFRIDFRAAAFQDATLGGVLEKSGPDLYFRVENAAGTLLIEESRSRAKDADRRDAGNVFTAELLVDL